MKILILTFGILLLTGCGTYTAFSYRTYKEDPRYMSTLSPETYPQVFPAVTVDLDSYCWVFRFGRFNHGMDPASKWIHGFTCVPTFIGTTVDLPISIVTDTLCFPYDIYRKRTYEDSLIDWSSIRASTSRR